jgi:hypothetical protein
MAQASRNPLAFALRLSRGEAGAAKLGVDVTNTSAAPQTVIAHARYLTVEREDEVGQFIRAEVPGFEAAAMPRAADYVTVAPGKTVSLFELDITGLPPKARMRVTYQAADRIMPNLPRDKQRSFFAGPADASTEKAVPPK